MSVKDVKSHLLKNYTGLDQETLDELIKVVKEVGVSEFLLKEVDFKLSKRDPDQLINLLKAESHTIEENDTKKIVNEEDQDLKHKYGLTKDEYDILRSKVI